MEIKFSKTSSNFIWTAHAKDKMDYYRLSPSRVLRVFRHPERVEEGVAPKTVAVMQPLTPKHTSEIWLMYQKGKNGIITIITAWRYPGKSPSRGTIPIPEEIKKYLRIN